MQKIFLRLDFLSGRPKSYIYIYIYIQQVSNTTELFWEEYSGIFRPDNLDQVGSQSTSQEANNQEQWQWNQKEKDE